MNENATPPPPPPSMPEPPAGGGGGGAQSGGQYGGQSGGQSSNRSVMIVLSYLWLLALIPLLVEKDDPEVQWHAKHGLVLFGLELLIWIASTVASSFLACLGCMVVPIIMLAFLVVRILCMVKGLNGERFLIPWVSDLVGKF